MSENEAPTATWNFSKYSRAKIRNKTVSPAEFSKELRGEHEFRARYEIKKQYNPALDGPELIGMNEEKGKGGITSTKFVATAEHVVNTNKQYNSVERTKLQLELGDNTLNMSEKIYKV